MAKVFRVMTAAVAMAAMSAVFTPAFAAFNLSGYYEPVRQEDIGDRSGGPEPGDYTGMPINEAARLRADNWNASTLTQPERQCLPHDAFYGWRSIGAVQIWQTVDIETQKVVKIDTDVMFGGREIWMDGRPHPSESTPHTWQGFSTGRWDGDVLVVHTTHLKTSHIRRNGLVHSDKAVLDERFFYHDGILNHVQMLTDPVYLTEPLVRTTVFVRRPQTIIFALPCRPAVEIPRPWGAVPHTAFRDSSGSVEFARKTELPLAAIRGGAETLLPEFADSPAAKMPVKPVRSGAK